MALIKHIRGYVVVASLTALLLSPCAGLAQPEQEGELIQVRPNPMARVMRPSVKEGKALLLNDGRQLQQGLRNGQEVWFLVGRRGELTVANGRYTLQNGQRLKIERGEMARMRLLK